MSDGVFWSMNWNRLPLYLNSCFLLHNYIILTFYIRVKMLMAKYWSLQEYYNLVDNMAFGLHHFHSMLKFLHFDRITEYNNL